MTSRALALTCLGTQKRFDKLDTFALGTWRLGRLWNKLSQAFSSSQNAQRLDITKPSVLGAAQVQESSQLRSRKPLLVLEMCS